MTPLRKNTIDTIARMAGVSVSTVSRVMNRPEIVKEDKRRRVLEVMKELDYSPSPLARALATDSLGLVGIMVPNITNQANAQIVYAAMDRLEQSGYRVLLFDSRENFEREIEIYHSVPKRMIDGIIVIFGNGENSDYLELAQGLPVVLAGPPNLGIPLGKLGSDESGGFRNLLGYLHGLGHRNIGFFYGSVETKGAQRRIQFFRNAMNDFGLDCRDEWLLDCPWSLEGGYQAATVMLERAASSLSGMPTAVIGTSDQIAIGSMRRFREAGLSIPADISVAGFDNSPMARYVTPSLTSLDFPHSKIGEKAAELIIAKVRKEDSLEDELVLPLEVVKRESTAPPARAEERKTQQ